MKTPYFLKNTISEQEKKNFETAVITDNVHRGKILAIVVSVFEVMYIIIDIISVVLKVDSRFEFNNYLVMYSLMIIINIMYLLFIRKFDNASIISENQRKKFNIAIIVYITLILSWGSVVSLMDQKLYGQLMAYVVNITICSVIYLLDNKKILIPYCISALILIIGLPYFQNSSDILIGHYVNLVVFIIISWLASRLLYHNYCENYTGKMLLNRSSLLLEKEIEEKRQINLKLAIANERLKELAAMDELTGIPNRRSFRNFMDRAFELYIKEDSTLSIIIIDIDFFKQYNDYYGHEEGDKTLIAVANQINSTVKEPSECVVRWGGEEFIYAAFNKSKQEVNEIANTIKAKVSALKIAHISSSIDTYISVSLGMCTIHVTKKEDINKAIILADRALYFAKSSGRNCVKALGTDMVK